MFDRPGQARRTLAAIAALGFVAVTAYLPALATGFTADDFFILARVKQFDGLAHPLAYFQTGFFDYYRPIAFLTHAGDWQLWGLSAIGFHLTNVVLHAANTVLVFVIGRRLLGSSAGVVSGLLFALHPSSHEAVYWIAARFDLLATFFTLVAVWCLAGDSRLQRAVGVGAFALGLLSKESAISLLLISPAWDVFVAKRDSRAVVRRLLPLVAVVAAYVIVRGVGADLAVAGGERRMPKLVMTVVMLLLIVGRAWREQRAASHREAEPPRWWAALGLATIAGVALQGPAPIAAAAAKGLASTAYAAFYLLSPVVFPSPPAAWFDPSTARDALPGLLALWACLAVAAFLGRAIARHAAALFLCAFIASALIPVSSMIGGLRYLYLATAGVSLLVACLLQRIPNAGRHLAAALVALMLTVSLTQLLHAGRAWRAGADMTRNGVALMASSLQPCGTKDLILLTTPVGIGGVYANFYYESFDVLAECSPRTMRSILRVVGTDAHVDVSMMADGTLELRVPDYRGNIVASEDLRNFTIAVPPGEAGTIETPAGRIETSAMGTAQLFRITLTSEARAAALFYYSGGRVRKP